MDYNLKFADGDKVLLQQMLKNKERLPDRFKTRPSIPKSLEFIFEAFFDLETERNVGYVARPIPYFKIVEYAKMCNITDDCYMQDFIYLIRKLDDYTLEYWRKKKDS